MRHNQLNGNVQAYLLKNVLNFVPQNLGNGNRLAARSHAHLSRLGLKRPPSRLVFGSDLWTRRYRGVNKISLQNGFIHTM